MRKLFTFLINILPWIILTFFRDNNLYLVSSVIILCIILIVICDNSFLQKGIVIAWFNLIALAMLVFLLLFNFKYFNPKLDLVMHTFFMLLGIISLLICHPYTLDIARLTTPKEVHASIHFYRVNQIITLMWTIIPLVNMLLSYYKVRYRQGIAYILLGIALLLTKYIPKLYKRILL